MNIKKVIAVTSILYAFTLSGTCFAQNYKIIKIKPNQKILIGEKWCGLNDVFSEEDVIYWNDSLEVQAFQAIELSNRHTLIEASKNRVRRLTRKNYNYKYLHSLMSKGNDGDLITWWDGAPIVMEILRDSNYNYIIVVNEEGKNIPIITVDNSTENKLILPADFFLDYSGIIQFEIQRVSLQNSAYIETVGIYEIEIAK